MLLDNNMMWRFAELNKTLDEDYEKLSDKLKNLELSHNRKKRALIRIKDIVSSDSVDVELIYKVCLDALFCDGRERSKK